MTVLQNIKGYVVQEQIGSGGFGDVYRAERPVIGGDVAIKVVHSSLASQPDFIRRFENEAQMVARLDHLHIVPLHDYWRDPNGAYLVMRWLKGGSLREVLKQSALSPQETRRIVDQICAALDHAHRQGVIHRDLKPANILFDEDGNAYLADFGIAKDLSSNQVHTGANEFVGTVGYTAPEQVRGETVSARTDVYSLGVILYEMLSGEHPFPNLNPVEQIYKSLHELLPLLNNLDANICDAVNQVIQIATAKDPKERYADTLEFASAFREAISDVEDTTPETLIEVLTRREQDILKLIVDGKSNQEIATTLFISMNTVKWYITQIYKKLRVRNRVQAIVKARELNLIVAATPDDDDAVNTHAGTYLIQGELQNPYKGLNAFQMADEQDFFGRTAIIQRILRRMQDDSEYYRFLSIIGPSGSGKSSLVKAGLIPAILRGELPSSDQWFIVDMIPGNQPIDELEVALMKIAADQGANIGEQLNRDSRGLVRVSNLILPDDGVSELVIMIDQFEEVFTLVEDEGTRNQFLDLIHYAVTDKRSKVRIVTTLRADFYDRPLQYSQIGNLIRERMETILPLSATELEVAITQPSARTGVTFETGLVATIIADVNYQVGALPLLQYALTELFDRREGRVITNAVYQEIGGAGAALARRADEIYSEFSSEGQETIRQIFLRLVTLGEGTEDTRRRVPRSELMALADGNDDLIDEIINAFVDRRLLALDHDPISRKPTVEVAHEAILREWERLRRWLNDSRDDIKQGRTVSRAAHEWDLHNRDVSFLLRGARLEQVETWRNTTNLAQTPIEEEFFLQSLDQRKKEAQTAQDQKARETRLEKRSQRFMRGLVAVFGVALIVATGLLLLAQSESSRANSALDDAEQSAKAFRSIALSIGAQDAINEGQPDVALALALEAINMDNPPPAANDMFFNASSSTWIQHRFNVSDNRVYDAVYHPDGERLITTDFDGRAIVWDIEAGAELQSFQRDNIVLLNMAVHPDGNLVAIGASDSLLFVWNLETNDVTELFTGNSIHVAIAFNSDGTLMVSSSDDGTITIRDTQTFTSVRSFEAHDGGILSINFSSDDSMLVTSSADEAVKIWDFESGELLQTRDTGGWVWDAYFVADDERILTAGADLGLFLWNWHDDEIIWSVSDDPSLESDVRSIALSPDEETFAISQNAPAATAQLRDLATGKRIRIYKGHTLLVGHVHYSPDGKHLVTASEDGTAIIWPVNWEGTIQTVFVEAHFTLAWHPTRPIVATAHYPGAPDTIIRLIDTRTGNIVHELEGHRQDVTALAFTPDGKYLLSGDEVPRGDTDQHVYGWDVETGERVFTLEGHQMLWISDIAISADGLFAAVSGSLAEIVLWDLKSGKRLTDLVEEPEQVVAVVFSPDARYLYSGGRKGTLLQWNLQTGEIENEKMFGGHDNTIHQLEVNNDGTWLLSASADHTATIWDTNSGQALMTLVGHTDEVTDVDFSPDEDMIVTASQDGRIIFWDAHTGEKLHVFVVGNETPYLRVAFSPDGTQIVSAANDILTFWDMSALPDDFVTWIGDNRYVPDFSCDQRLLYTIEPLCDENG